jgi:hypothetical protein
MRIFISHSSHDQNLAEAVIDLLRSAMALASQDIRCTSVDGYRLPAGANTIEQLRLEVSNAEAFIGIISPASLQSAYVIFELGARWGRGTHMAPLLAPGMEAATLKGPLQGINALRADSPAQLHQLVAEVGEVLSLQLEPPASYQKKVGRVLALGNSTVSSSSRSIGEIAENQMRLTDPFALGQVIPDSIDVEAIVRRMAAEEHPGDFSTQRYVINGQLKAWRALRQSSDPDLPVDVLQLILKQAASEHPHDFSTQLYVVNGQVADWKSLNLRR